MLFSTSPASVVGLTKMARPLRGRGRPSLVARCAGITRAGRRCTNVVAMGSDYCYQHDPARSEERRRNAQKAARGPRATAEMREIKDEIRDVISRVLSDSEDALDKGKAAVALQGYNTLLRALALEREVKETEELAAEIAELREELNRSEHGATA